jgi:protein phosphatase
LDKIAIISDIHGNIPALEAVLSNIRERGIDELKTAVYRGNRK